MVTGQMKVSRIFLGWRGGGGEGVGALNLNWHCCKMQKTQSPINRSAAYLNLSE